MSKSEEKNIEIENRNAPEGDEGYESDISLGKNVHLNEFHLAFTICLT